MNQTYDQGGAERMILAITPAADVGRWNVHRADGTTDRDVPWSGEMTAYAAGRRGYRLCPAQ